MFHVSNMVNLALFGAPYYSESSIPHTSAPMSGSSPTSPYRLLSSSLPFPLRSAAPRNAMHRRPSAPPNPFLHPEPESSSGARQIGHTRACASRTVHTGSVQLAWLDTNTTHIRTQPAPRPLRPLPHTRANCANEPNAPSPPTYTRYPSLRRINALIPLHNRHRTH